MIKIGINGFGRIGRAAFRAALTSYADKIEVVALNTSGSVRASSWAHLLAFDSVYGRFGKKVEVDKGQKGELGVFRIEGNSFPVLGQRNPAKIPWQKYGAEVVLEATGVFRLKKEAQKHLKGGAKKVIISAPTKDETPVYLMGVNSSFYKGEKIISNGSCTTNCVAPVVKVIKENFKFSKAFVSTIHAYTSSQELVDGSSKDLRRARAAAINIVPTGTGAAIATSKAVSGLKGRFDGLAFRVPVVCGSLCDFTFILDQTVTDKKINQAFDKASSDPRYQGILAITKEPLVSTDIIGSSFSAIVDFSFTRVIDGNLVKLLAWYDNEWAYCCRLLELAALIGQ